MERLYIKAEGSRPEIDFNPDTGELLVGGKSNPEDVIGFYTPILEWLNEFIKNPPPNIMLNFKLVYYNTASSKLILEILKKMELASEKGSEVLVRWYYDEDDDDMEELGEDYADLVDVAFEQIPTEVND